MTIKLMRRIDYWLGIPLCFLLSLINTLRLFTFRKEENKPLRKILFIKLSEMGSIILAYPLINRIKKEFPEAEIFFLTFKNNAALFNILEIMPYSHILSIRKESAWLFILDTLKILRETKNKKIDIVFDLEIFSRFTVTLSYLIGAAKRVGFYRYSMEGLYLGNLLTHKVQYNPLLHISKSYLSLGRIEKLTSKSTPEIEEKLDDEEIYLPWSISSEVAKSKAWGKLKDLDVDEEARLFLINPGEGNIPLREWSLDNFISLAKRLLEDKRNFIILIGTEEATKKTGLFYKSINDKRCISLVGKTTLSEILDLFNIAEALITNDCGLAHLASLTPIKKFILFGPESPQVYSPLANNTWIIYSGLACSPCLSAFNHRKSACKDNKCLKLIEAAEVYELIKKHQ